MTKANTTTDNARKGTAARKGVEASMVDLYTLPLSSVTPGQLVVCHQIKGFEGGRMGARVLADSAMHRPAREGMAWVRETGLGVDPASAWTTEWPIRLMA